MLIKQRLYVGHHMKSQYPEQLFTDGGIYSHMEAFFHLLKIVFSLPQMLSRHIARCLSKTETRDSGRIL